MHLVGASSLRTSAIAWKLVLTSESRRRLQFCPCFLTFFWSKKQIYFRKSFFSHFFVTICVARDVKKKIGLNVSKFCAKITTLRSKYQTSVFLSTFYSSCELFYIMNLCLVANCTLISIRRLIFAHFVHKLFAGLRQRLRLLPKRKTLLISKHFLFFSDFGTN